MAELLYAKLLNLSAQTAELLSIDGRRVDVPRGALDPEKRLDGQDEQTVRTYLGQKTYLLVTVRSGAVSEHDGAIEGVIAPTGSDEWLQRAMGLEPGSPMRMDIRDANSNLFAYGAAPGGFEARCGKLAIRRFLQERAVLPLMVPEGHRQITEDELVRAPLSTDAFWRLYYPEYELFPGDTVLGCLAGFEFDPQSSRRLLILDIASYLRRLELDCRDVFRHLAVEHDDTVGPAVEPHMAEAVRLGRPPPGVNSVLVVDDEVHVRNTLADLLAGRGLEAVSAAGENDARGIVNARCECGDPHFDLAIIDINLTTEPGNHEYRGIQFARWLQEKMPWCGIVLLSGEKAPGGNGGKAEVAGDLLALEYLHKPVGSRRLWDFLQGVGARQPTLARELFETREAAQHVIGDELRQAREQDVRDLGTLLQKCRDDLGADTVCVFSMHKVSREATIHHLVGRPFARYEERRKSLRYSPVRDVCEDAEAFCHRSVLMRWGEKHNNLISLCDREDEYRACAAAPVQGCEEDSCYGIFAFTYGRPTPDETTVPYGFRLSRTRWPRLPAPLAEEIHDALVIGCVREYAAHAARLLREQWLQQIQVRQHPFLMVGMADASMGHDLLNALQGAESCAAMLGDLLAGGQVPDQRQLRAIGTLQTLADRALRISTSFRDLSRAESEAETEFDLGDAVASACQSVQWEAERCHVQVNHPRNRLKKLQMKGRRGLVERALFNVVLNGVQQIGLSLRHRGFVEVRYFVQKQAHGDTVVIRVYDNGPGIHGFRREVIFRPGETTRPDGTGLGLHICRQELAELSHSIARVHESIMFCGSSFEIVLSVGLLVKEVKKGDTH